MQPLAPIFGSFGSVLISLSVEGSGLLEAMKFRRESCLYAYPRYITVSEIIFLDLSQIPVETLLPIKLSDCLDYQRVAGVHHAGTQSLLFYELL